MDNKKKDPNLFRTIAMYAMLVAAAVLILSALGMFGNSSAQTSEVTFTEFVEDLKSEKVTKLYISEGNRSYEAELKDGTKIVSYAPTAYDMAIISEKYIIPQADEGTLSIKSIRPSILAGFLSWIPTLLLIGFMFFFYSKMMGGTGNRNVMNFGKNRARLENEGDKRITFKDVAGLDEEKQELSEIVDFLKNPKKYLELGARIPKGVLLVGPPGTGKTYLSKAVAGEAGVPFFSISGSDFVEMFVGVGASRVRDLFEDAKKNSPCIIFIDEIDAVGRRRGAGIGGGNDEREQTLNQLLVEMDGFGVNEGIVILAATNRPDVLDPAILRPGRFDREVTINAPDVKGREAVFALYAKGKPIDPNVDMKVLAKRTPGFTPADIENMMNEAALLTARRNGTIIHMDDLEEAITRVIAGPKKKSRVMTEKERKLTAYHEGGHAVVSRSIPGYDPVHQVTIMPRGMAGGFTMNLPENDRYYNTKGDMLDEIAVLLGGRVSEALNLGDISTGASNDLERATKLAHDMVTKYGMTNAIGPVNYSSSDEVFLGRDWTSKQNFSEELAGKIDAEVRKILEEQYKRAEDILKENQKHLDDVADALLELETLDADEFEGIFTGSKTVDQIKDEEAVQTAARERTEKLEAQARADREKAEAEENAKREQEKAQFEMRSQYQPQSRPNATRVAVFDKDGKPVIKNVNRPADPEEVPKASEPEVKTGDTEDQISAKAEDAALNADQPKTAPAAEEAPKAEQPAAETVDAEEAPKEESSEPDTLECTQAERSESEAADKADEKADSDK